LLLVQFMVGGFALVVWAGATSGPQQLPADVSGNWWAQAQEDIRRSEYRPSLSGKTVSSNRSEAFQAPNRAHNLRTTFTSEGVWVVSRTSTSQDWRWGLTLAAVGVPGDMRRPEEARLQVAGNRVEFLRGAVTEWYINDERGLEQGFTLQGPPPGSEGARELVLRLDVRGTMTGSMEGSAIAFAPQGEAAVLRYGHLQAFDATGRELPARFGLVAGGLEIAVATAGAEYPILIDPLATSVIWTAESNQAGAMFGHSVSTAGDVNGDGYADVIVGAYLYDSGQTDEGAVFVYHGSAKGLSRTPNWIAVSDQAGANFGYSVSTAGDVNGDGYADVIVGARGFDNSQTDEGAAFVYHGSATGLSPTPNWKAVSDQTEVYFGNSVSTAGDVNGDGYADVIVGDSFYDNGQYNEGAAFVYHGSASGLSHTPNWTAESNQDMAFFGSSVSTAGDVNGDGYSDVIVGAPGRNAVFVYHGSATGLSADHNWTAESDQGGMSINFSRSVSTAGDVNGDGYADVIVGAPGYDPDMKDWGRRGAAFVYHGSATGLSSTPNWTAKSDRVYYEFGHSVSTAGDVNGDGFADVIVGAPLISPPQDPYYKSAALVYHGSSSGLSPTPNWKAVFYEDQSNFGSSVSTAGDIDGDGCAEFIVGNPWYDNGQTDEGGAVVYDSSPSVVKDGSFYLLPKTSGGTAVIYLD
jgi:hypothetical protein